MKIKKVLCLVFSAVIASAGLAGCSQKADKTDHTVAVTQEVTNIDGEVVTDENGQVVTEVVTDKNGLPVTKVADSDDTAASAKSSSSDMSSASGTSSSKANSNSKTTKKKSSSKSSTAKSTTAESKTEYIDIVLQPNRKASSSSSNVTIGTGEVTIEKGGNYRIKSKTDTWHGQIIVKLKNTEKAELRFENVTISNDTKNIIKIIDSSIKTDRDFTEMEADAGTTADNMINEVSQNDKAPNVSLSFPQGTSSSFTTSANSYTGIIYNESKLTIKGKGSVSISASKNANNCICSTKSITIKNVNVNLTTAAYDSTSNLAKTQGSAKGIFSYSKVTLESGTLKIKSNGDGIRCDSFYALGGTLDLKSSACDGIDADDAIVISGGEIKAVALQKHSFKVRRVNSTEDTVNGGNKKVRSGKNDCFRINGGTVWGESKKITSLEPEYQSDKKGSSQASVTAKIVKKNTAQESKTPAIITIGGINKTSKNKCTKFIYSSSSVKKGQGYKAEANGNSASVVWHGNAAVAEVKTNSNK